MTRDNFRLRTVGCLRIFVLFQIVLATSPTLTGTTQWVGGDGNGGSGEFQIDFNWDAGVPGISETAQFFESGATPTVTFTADEASGKLEVLDGNVTFVSDSALLRTYALTAGAADVLVQGGNLNIGLETNPVFLNVGDLIQVGTGPGDGIVVVEGSQSRLDVLGTGTHNIGDGGATGQLYVLSNATATIGHAGTIEVGVDSNNSTTGFLGVGSGGSINVGSLAIGTNLSGATGDVSVTDIGSTISQVGASTLAIGSASGGTGSLGVFEGTFTSGSGAITIDDTGTVNIQNGGTFNANGPLTISAGGTLTLNDGSLTANAGLDNSAGGTLGFLDGTLTVSGGAFAPNAGGVYTIEGPTLTELPHLVLGVGATANIGNDLFVGEDNRGELTIQNGGTFSNINGIIGESSDSIGTATVTDPNSTWTNSGNLIVGFSGDGTLNVTSGGAVSSLGGLIGISSGSTSTATVTDPDSTWTNSVSLFVGNEGNGTLNIQNGGAVSNVAGFVGNESDSIGSVTVDGEFSTWTNFADMFVGFSGEGTLNIQNGGAVSNTFGGVANQDGSIGTVTVDGADSIWTNFAGMEVGSSGNGTLNILNGGKVSNTLGKIGGDLGSTSTATVDGDDGLGNPSTWTNFDNLHVGFDGNGMLNIQNGGAVFNTSGRIGSQVGSIGTVTVDGDNGSGIPSTWTNFGSLYVGFLGNGTLNIQNGGAVSNTLSGNIGRSAGSTGTATVDGTDSTWTLSSSLTVGGSSTLAGGTGTLDVLNNGLVDVGGTLKIWNPGTVTLDGGSIDATTIDNTDGGTFDFIDGTLTVDTFLGDLTQDGGTISPGDSPGTTTITGNYTINAGTLEIEIGGLIQGTEYDFLDVAGNVDLGGTLDVSLIDGFVPAPGDAFEIITAASILGTFATESLPALPGSLEWFVHYSGTSVELTSTFAGDFDFDGDVDGADFLEWQQGLGSIYDANDLADWEANYGAVASLAETSTAVPEPNSLALLSLGGLLALRSFRRASAFAV